MGIKKLLRFCLFLITVLTVYTCSASKKLSEVDFHMSDAEAETIVKKIHPADNLRSIKGKGRAIVSEPGNTERVTLLFKSNRQKSMVTVRNSIGIEGGLLLTDGDTLLIYNKIDGYVRKIPVRGGHLEDINRLASLNILKMVRFPVPEDDVQTVLENKEMYKLKLNSGTEIYVDKEKNVILKVTQPAHSRLPYSKITYGAYGSLKGFTLPRRITIFGAEEKSKIALQITSLELNPDLDSLTVNIPKDIPVYYR